MNDDTAASRREDADDLAAFTRRAHEPLLPLAQALKELKRRRKGKLNVGSWTLDVES